MNLNFASAIMLNSNQPNAELIVLDANNQIFINFVSNKTYSSLTVSNPDLKVGNTYIIQTETSKNSVKLTFNIYGIGS